LLDDGHRKAPPDATTARSRRVASSYEEEVQGVLIPKRKVVDLVRDLSGADAALWAASVLPDWVNTRDPVQRRKLKKLGVNVKALHPGPPTGF